MMETESPPQAEEQSVPAAEAEDRTPEELQETKKRRAKSHLLKGASRFTSGDGHFGSSLGT